MGDPRSRRGRVDWCSSPLPSDEEIAEALERVYGERLLRFRSGWTPHARSFSRRVQTSAGDRFLKVDEFGASDTTAPAEAVRACASSTRLIAPVAPRAAAAAIDAASRVSLWPYIASQPYESARARVLDAGRQLACLHGCPIPSLPTRSVLQWLFAFLPQRPTVWQTTARGLLRPWLQPQMLEHLVQAVNDLRAAAAGFSSTTCHGDYRAQNIAFASQGVVAVLDAGGLHRGWKLLDIAYSLVYFHAVVKPCPLLRERAEDFLTGYREAGWLLRSETSLLETASLAAFMRGRLLWAHLARHSTAGEEVLAGLRTSAQDLEATRLHARRWTEMVQR